MSGTALTLDQIDAHMSRGPVYVDTSSSWQASPKLSANPNAYVGTYQTDATRFVAGQVSTGTQGALATPESKSSKATAWAVGGGMLGALAALIKVMFDWSAIGGPSFWAGMGTIGLWALIGIAAGYLLGKMID